MHYYKPIKLVDKSFIKKGRSFRLRSERHYLSKAMLTNTSSGFVKYKQQCFFPYYVSLFYDLLRQSVRDIEPICCYPTISFNQIIYRYFLNSTQIAILVNRWALICRSCPVSHIQKYSKEVYLVEILHYAMYLHPQFKV